MMRRLILALSILGMASGANAAGMGVAFEWGPTKKCFDPKSPPITLSSVPQGAVKLEINMVDKNATGFNHGGGSVAFKGQSQLPYGAFKYKGPCPPNGTHFYSITVKAMDATGKILDKASAVRPYSAK